MGAGPDWTGNFWDGKSDEVEGPKEWHTIVEDFTRVFHGTIFKDTRDGSQIEGQPWCGKLVEHNFKAVRECEILPGVCQITADEHWRVDGSRELRGHAVLMLYLLSKGSVYERGKSN